MSNKSDSILIFTFSPVQSFIAEARRAADLYMGSQILVELAKAAAQSIGKENLIYPALDENGELPQDIPNKLVAKVPWDDCETIADNARKVLLKCWKEEIAQNAWSKFEEETGLPFDSSIWNHQTSDDYLWETYWSAAKLDGGNYKQGYTEAEAGLVATKFTRPFAQYLEHGFKDTLSGKREALHATGQDGRDYWFQVGQIEKITPIKIRPSVDDPNNPERRRPRERLDAIGVIKRFRILGEDVKDALAPFHGFPSTSSIASLAFLESAKEYCKSQLDGHHKAVASLLSHDKKYEIRDDDLWKYDGDLLYPESLRPKRMESDYGKTIPESNLKPATETLSELNKALQNKRDELRKSNNPRYTSILTHPSPYYAIIVLDGDNMGKYLNTLDEEGHRDFSARLRRFSTAVPGIAKKHLARVIYNGGDDVLALAPLSTAFAFTRELAQTFEEKTARTASAGIAISHHLSPLGTALRAARRAEHTAKELPCKDAVCILVLKRSGEPIQVRSGWDGVPPFERMIESFVKDELSSRLPYDVARSAYALPKADDKLEAELYRLIKRHWQQKSSDDEKDASARDLSLILRKWAESFHQTISPSPSEELAGWLALARFIAKGGHE